MLSQAWKEVEGRTSSEVAQYIFRKASKHFISMPREGAKVAPKNMYAGSTSSFQYPYMLDNLLLPSLSKVHDVRKFHRRSASLWLGSSCFCSTETSIAIQVFLVSLTIVKWYVFFMVFFLNETSCLECCLDEYQKKFRFLVYIDKLGDCPKLKPKATCLRCVLPRLTLLECTLFKFVVFHVIAYPYWNWPKILLWVWLCDY